jgi:hypothetical protein
MFKCLLTDLQLWIFIIIANYLCTGLVTVNILQVLLYSTTNMNNIIVFINLYYVVAMLKLFNSEHNCVVNHLV